MTIKELYDYTVKKLYFSDSADFETQCLFEDLLGFSKSQILFNNNEAYENQIKIIEEAITRRSNGEPLQYILGKWDFYDMTFYVGKGVLIPRPETEMLVDIALDFLKNKENPIIYDLCSGTGCIGLTIAKHLKNSKVYLFEKEKSAYTYLEKNLKKYDLSNAEIINCDIFTYDKKSLPKCDVLISNPPYIESDLIASLQKEVKNEPISALDGGADGLDFYREICRNWVQSIKKNGMAVFECGENQTELIKTIFKDVSVDSKVYFDFNHIDRIVSFII